MPSIYISVTINDSKEKMCFNDFSIPEYFPNYTRNSKLMDYFRMYLNTLTKVQSVRKHQDFSFSGQWDVIVEVNGKQKSFIFDGIFICSGHHTDPYLPLQSFSGIEKFEGSYFHSRKYKKVVGIGNSGVDIAVELNHVVFLSTQRGAWILHCVWENGYPMDSSPFTQFNTFFLKIVTAAMANNQFEKRLNFRFNHAHYGLQPQHGFLSQHPAISDDLPNHIISGRVQVKPNVEECTETDASFDDDSTEETIDVIFATGYRFFFPFPNNLINVTNNKVSLYKFMFPHDLEKSTLAVIGLIQPLGIILPIAELQSRWAKRVSKNMLADIAQKQRAMEKQYVKTPRHTIQVDHIEYMGEIATPMGVKPNLLFLFLSDPELAVQVLFGPCTPYQYCLQGPGKWTEHMIKLLRTQITIQDNHSSLTLSWINMAPAGLALLTAGLAYFRYIHHRKWK
uniref:Flavin-containing monooxygenase n=1 Tax=Moschus moschiferus TaxID=68415 RepID=A0A8C6E072_MOSMO